MQKFGRPTRTSCSILKIRVGVVSLDTWNPSPKKTSKNKKPKQTKKAAICHFQKQYWGSDTTQLIACACVRLMASLDSSQLRSVLRRQHREFFSQDLSATAFLESWDALRTTLCQEWSSHFYIISLWSFVMCSEQSTYPMILLAMTVWQVCISVLVLQSACLEAH